MRRGTARGTEAPMDYQWTNRSDTRPAWAMSNNNTPQKRPHEDAQTNAQPSLESPFTPRFGANQNMPFIFNQTPLQSPPYQPWTPPPHFSAEKAFPKFEEPKDVDMLEVSPEKMDEKRDASTSRIIASGALRRVFRARQKSRDSKMVREQKQDEQDGEDDSSEDESPRNRLMAPVTTSNHYTLNMPAAPSSPSDFPYVLLGYVQFLFNFSLVVLFLYLVIQFILTVQRDVEHRISEYSMDIVQEIALCALQYKTNLCASNPIPAMVQQCGIWETCMNRDPSIIGRARVSAELIAEIVNGFIEPISWKALFFALTSLSFLTVFINSLLSLYRTRIHPNPAAPAPSHLFPTAPACPPNPAGTYLTSTSAPGWTRAGVNLPDEDSEIPTRRRRLEAGSVKIK